MTCSQQIYQSKKGLRLTALPSQWAPSLKRTTLMKIKVTHTSASSMREGLPLMTVASNSSRESANTVFTLRDISTAEIKTKWGTPHCTNDYDLMSVLDDLCCGPDDDSAHPGTHTCCDKMGHMLAITNDPGVLEVRGEGHVNGI